MPYVSPLWLALGLALVLALGLCLCRGLFPVAGRLQVSGSPPVRCISKSSPRCSMRRALGAMPGTQTRRAACGLRPAIGLGLFPRLSGSVSDLGDLGLSLCLALGLVLALGLAPCGRPMPRARAGAEGLVCMARALDWRKRQYGTWDLFVFITVPLDPIERCVQPF